MQMAVDVDDGMGQPRPDLGRGLGPLVARSSGANVTPLCRAGQQPFSLDLARMRARPGGQAAGADGRAGGRRRRRPDHGRRALRHRGPFRRRPTRAGPFARRTVAVVLADDPWPHLFTPYPASAPDELPADHVHPPSGPRPRRGRWRWPRPWSTCWARPGRVAVDDYTLPMWSALPPVLAGAELVDAGPLFTAARLHKTPDEVECLRRSWRDQRGGHPGGRGPGPARRPASRAERGLPVRAVPAGCDDQLPGPGVPAHARADRRRAVEHERRHPLQPGHDRPRPVRGRGDLDRHRVGLRGLRLRRRAGPGWSARERGAPRPARAWEAITDAVLAEIRPGVTADVLTRVATEVNGGTKPWLDHFFLGHGSAWRAGRCSTSARTRARPTTSSWCWSRA